MTGWHQVGRALLGRWPNQVAAWGEEGIAAFVEELQAEGLDPDAALVGLRMHRSEFPPSVSAVSDNARRDPSAPTFEEMLELWRKASRARPAAGRYDNEAHMLRARDDAVRAKAFEFHPLVGSFVERYGAGRLRALPLDDPDWGERRKAELREAWERHCQVMAGREIAALASGRRDGLARLDPLAALGVRPQISSGE